MRRTSGRPFGVGDAMIAIGLSAIAMAAMRSLFGSWFPPPPLRVRPPWGVHPQVIAFALMSAAIWASAWTAAFLAMRLRRPRPQWAALARQPGTAAACAAGLAAAVQAVFVLLRLTLTAWQAQYSHRVGPFLVIWASYSGRDLLRYYALPFSAGVASPCGFAVAGAWLALALGGRWRAEKTWIDRAGRCLGIAWIVLGLVAQFAA